jgi:hypothetical protein
MFGGLVAASGPSGDNAVVGVHRLHPPVAQKRYDRPVVGRLLIAQLLLQVAAAHALSPEGRTACWVGAHLLPGRIHIPGGGIGWYVIG